MAYSKSEEDRERSLSSREVDELIDSIINPPTASQKVRVKRKRGRSPVLHAPQLLQPTDAELRSELGKCQVACQEPGIGNRDLQS